MAAALPLNNFRTITAVVGITPNPIYRCPLGFKAVFLMGQVTNVSNEIRYVTFTYTKNNQDTPIVFEYPVPPKDTLNLLTGKLVLETLDTISIEMLGPSSSELKFIASILETSA
jgi:hypothetical protein